MFKSRVRPIVVPQAEHGRLSGILASLWGNEAFDLPAMDFDSFVLGVTSHDRGYGVLDNSPLFQMPADDWNAIQRNGITQGFDDPVANIVTLMHIKRLLGYSDVPELNQLVDQHIKQSLIQTDVPTDVFVWADKITRLCDNIAFDFSFEKMIQKPTDVHPRRDSEETVTIHHRLEDNGVIRVDPWVFSVEEYHGFIMGYELEGYPDKLEPVLMPFTLRQYD